MAGIRISIDPTIVNWVIHNVPSDKASSDVFDTLANWKEGVVQPTFKQIESLSNKVHIPLGYFFLKKPPKEELPVLEYRTVNSIATETPSRDLVDTITYAENVQNWMKNHLIDIGADMLGLVGSGKKTELVEQFAETIRKTIDIKVNWYADNINVAANFKFIRTKLEKIGILVLMNGVVGNNTRRKLNIKEFRAFTLIDRYAPLIFINGNDSDGAKLFSLLHETVHIWLGIDSFYNSNLLNDDSVSNTEKLCNAVTAELLVPNQIFNEQWMAYSPQYASKKAVIGKLASTFRCGITTIARRAKDNNYINAQQYKEIADEAVENYSKFVKNRADGGDFYKTTAPRLDTRFLLALDNSVKEGKTQYTDAYRLTNLNRTTFSNLMDKVRGGSQ